MPWRATSAFTLVLSVAYAVHKFLENRALGALTHIHTNDTLYERKKYGHILDYDKHSFIIHGQPTLILSGEFHYWRLPDRDRWRDILEQYRSAGLNCIRIYFHWGFHSPSEDQYIFEGNRDIEYLLQICEELGLYVLAAPGPYICAETQAGGFPIWLAAKREIRLRHMKTNLWKEYDPIFMAYCVEYFEQILPILARHQITNGSNGCVIALQIENESFQHVFGYPIGLHDDMKVLAMTARECGMTVPLFTNDGFEQGSFIVKDDPKREKQEFGIDLYGVDKYVVFTPNSEPTSWMFGRNPSHLPEWNPTTVMKGMDKLEETVRSFGHANLQTPIFIPELQGGWFNHYGLPYTYDDIYKFYGDQYTRLMLDTVFSQGCTMLNFYMFYGGTNWGTIGDSDVYTSYDYSACIRENGLMSGRLRKLRLGLLFLQSFSDVLARTDAVSPSKSATVSSSLGNTICQQRRSLVTGSRGPIELTFLRNFSTKKLNCFDLLATPNGKKSPTTRLACHLPYKSSFVALGNYTTINPDIHLILSATPIHIRGFTGDSRREVWIAALAESGATEMAFRGDLALKDAGSSNNAKAGIQLRLCPEDQDIKLLSIPEGTKNAYVVLSSASDSATAPLLHVIFLDQTTLSTLYCFYDNRHSDKKPASQDPLYVKNMASSPKIVTWGSYNARYDPVEKVLAVDSTSPQQEVHVLSFGQDIPLLKSIEGSTVGPGLPYQVTTLKANKEAKIGLQSAAIWAEQHRRDTPLLLWETRTTDFKSLNWKACPKVSSSDRFQNVNLDYHFTSGHILYRGTFTTHIRNGLLWSYPQASLTINARHRVIAFVNGTCLGSHMTYSRQLMRPGAKMGYDPVSQGSHTILIPQNVIEQGIQDPSRTRNSLHKHEIILVIESFGHSRQPFVVDDIRNPRGLLSASVRAPAMYGSDTWEVAGVDVRGLDMAYGSTGFPDEHARHGWTATNEPPRVLPDQGVTWWRTRFPGPPGGPPGPTSRNEDYLINMPLCCRLEGEFTAMIILNDTLVGRYFGSDSPQHDFYLMDGLVHKAETGIDNELKLMIYGAAKTEKFKNSCRIRIMPWIVEDAQGELGQWSGNTLFDAYTVQEEAVQAGPFWTLRQTIPLGSEI
ncbi:hypothetical protein BG011_004208 [Mortierella polycephala]|uniref:Glycoside hydrolase 35 catalytic domain-containing protein n=1 Tax=Mortierella polycephala TaxID=41804 RepID=A0A9P6U2Q3_9FUNG|nr:hypothetical protein BG011_004208 [Mortierella polycephala]